MQHRRISLCFCLYWSGLFNAHTAVSETIDVSTGLDNAQIVSSTYESKAFSYPFIEGTYTRNLFGRWSILGQFHANLNNKLSNGVVGFTIDSDDLLRKGGALAPDGSAEVTRAPIWLFRGYVGFGLFRFVDQLKSQDASLGSRNEVPVQADLFGIKAGLSVARFFGDRWAATGGLGYSVATASNFGINSTSYSLGVLYRNDP